MRRLSLLALAACSACATVAPGLQISEAKIRDRGTSAHPIDIVPISPELLIQQAGARARAAVARPAEPRSTTAPYEYRVAPFDVLSVIVWDHPELTIPAGEYRAADLVGNVVQADGTIFYPHVGVVEVGGKTLPEVRTVLTERLRKFVENPQLDVRVASFRGKRVQVSGEVLVPSTLPITDVPMHVQDAIAAAKGFTPNAYPPGATLVRGGKVYPLDLYALYERGDLSPDWLLQDGDVLHVPSREERKVFVLGEVRAPSSKLMAKGRMTLAEALGDSAGFDPSTSNPGGIYVIRGRYEAPQVFRLDASSADALLLAVQFELEPLDVVYVTPYALSNWNRVVLQILPTVQGLWQSVDLANRSANVIQDVTR